MIIRKYATQPHLSRYLAPRLRVNLTRGLPRVVSKLGRHKRRAEFCQVLSQSEEYQKPSEVGSWQRDVTNSKSDGANVWGNWL